MKPLLQPLSDSKGEQPPPPQKKKKRYLVHLSLVYLSWILSMKKVKRLRFWVPRMD